MARRNDESLEALIHGAQEGDAGDREELFALCRDYLGLMARAQIESCIRAKVDASDLVQQTLLEAYRDFDRFSGESSREWIAWLKRILTHNATDYVRRYRLSKKRQVGREIPIRSPGDTGVLGFGAPEPQGNGETPSEVLMRADDELRVAGAMMRLSEDHREVVMLRNFQRLSFNEVAERMDRTRPAVQMLWMRALKCLEKELVDDETSEVEGEDDA
jgi:RNA polymerase sigma-70 factor, ECF subfamily